MQQPGKRLLLVFTHQEQPLWGVATQSIAGELFVFYSPLKHSSGHKDWLRRSPGTFTGARFESEG